MNDRLNTPSATEHAGSTLGSVKRLLPLIAGEKRQLVVAFAAILFNCGATLSAPVIISRAVDASIRTGNVRGVWMLSGLLLAIYLVGLVASYLQTRAMGGVGRRVLFGLRNTLFTRLQELPVSFFHQHRAGDLISRMNNDTEKLNQLFSQFLMQFIGSFFIIVGAGLFVLFLNVRLGVAALLPALGIVCVTRLLSAWVKRQNVHSLQSLGALSAEIQESLSHFKVIVAFNRLDYFRQKLNEATERNFKASVGAAVANSVFVPLYTLASSCAQLLVLVYGIFLIVHGSMTPGLLIGFFLYVNHFYSPLRQLASVWSSMQQALAGLDRISELLTLESTMGTVPSEQTGSTAVVEFQDVSFRYPDGNDVLQNVSFSLEAGKTYALVGPTGGGKTTTASLMARLYDPTQGRVLLDGKDIRSYSPAERARQVGCILQEPFLFSGTVLENIFYGHGADAGRSDEERLKAIEEAGFGSLLSRFERGLQTQVQTHGDMVSLGQHQLIACMRAVLRQPKLLILDEATANIDTVTERLLEDVLRALPNTTTKVIIAHRLNTIQNADDIFFVNGGRLVHAGSFAQAVELLMHGHRTS